MSEKAFALLFRLSVLKVLPAGLGQEQGLRTLPLLPAAQMGPVWVKMGNLFWLRLRAELSRSIRQ